MINFFRYRRVAYLVSIALLAVGLTAYFTKGFRYYVDFAGGSEIQVSFGKSIEIGSVRKKLAEMGHKDAVIQSIGYGEQSFLIQVQIDDEARVKEFKKNILREFSEKQPDIVSINWIGPEVGKQIKFNAILSVLLSLLLILLYVTIRSKYRFAAGAVAAIAHDMLIVLTAFLLLGEQISIHVLAAILTVIGYSLNDTIVIFSRVRENLKKMHGSSEETIVNTSLNQTLRRTLLTSFSTLLAVGSIFLFGGQALHGFSLAMLIGIVVGTYSSIYVASPVMLALKQPSQK